VTVPAFLDTPEQMILETSFVDHPFDTSTPAWTIDRAGGKRFMSLSDTPWGWAPILGPANEYDVDHIGLRGLVIRVPVVCFRRGVEWKRARFCEVPHHG
jgi:hypothetical protein